MRFTSLAKIEGEAAEPLDPKFAPPKHNKSIAPPAYSKVSSIGGSLDDLALALVHSAVNIDWDDFEKFLRSNHRENTVRLRMFYAKKYHHIISTPEGPHRTSELQSLTNAQRREAMKSLANLAKYLGLYNGWRQLKEEHDLRWTRFDPEAQAAVFQEVFYSQEKGFSAMLEWFKDMRQRLPAEYVGFVDFLLLTGLRPDEGCHAINILKKNGFENYLNRERMILEHFKYPSIFIRRTKKAYVSVVSEPLLSAVDATQKGVIPDSYYDFYHKLYSKIVKNKASVPYRAYGKKLPMNNCRKIYGTWLRMNGIESEVIDLVQGRTASSVFAKHYFRPDFDETCEKIRMLTKQLNGKIN